MCNHHLRFLIRSCLQGHPLKGVEKVTDKISAREKSAARETTQALTFALTQLSGQTLAQPNTLQVVWMFPHSNSSWKLHQCTAVLDTFTELGRALDTLLSKVLLNFCPNLGSAALTCDTQRCSFTQNPTHNCDTETFTLEYYCLKHNSHWRKHNCSAILLLQNFGRLALSILWLVEFHCGPQLSQSVSSGMKWIWIGAYIWESDDICKNMRTQWWEDMRKRMKPQTTITFV